MHFKKKKIKNCYIFTYLNAFILKQGPRIEASKFEGFAFK